MRVSKSRWCALPLGLALFACDGEGPLPPPAAPPPVTPAAFAMVSGDQQEGKAGELLGEPFVVRAVDAQGNGLEDVLVIWRVTSGAGRFVGLSTSMDPHTRTGPDGLTQVTFEPTVLGTSAVAASAGYSGASVTFTTDASVLVIENSFWGVFLAPGDTREATVPVGTMVEWADYHLTWLNDPSQTRWRITSTSAPPGGASFDSGGLNKDGRFRFVPAVPGSWEWTWEYSDETGRVARSGQTGRLTAQ